MVRSPFVRKGKHVCVQAPPLAKSLGLWKWLCVTGHIHGAYWVQESRSAQWPRQAQMMLAFS
jgi:hypothetical protein